MRDLIIVLGDQLDEASSAFDGFDPSQDSVWMAEAAEESTHVWSSKQRTAMFLAAMRHFAEILRAKGWPLTYRRLDDATNLGSLAAELAATLTAAKPQRVVMAKPGDLRVLNALRAACDGAKAPLDVREDRHFYATIADFAAHAKGRKGLRLEFFYRELRQRFGVLMEPDPANPRKPQPIGGHWNFDADNRESFGKEGPGFVPPRSRFEPDAITREVIALVNERFDKHPGKLDGFAWPVTRAQALQSLDAFVTDRLPSFGLYQDALWEGEPWLYHSHLSAALNLKLLNPREVVAAAEAAYHKGHAPLAAVEGFIRQILGWREYVRGIYWTQMPDYAEGNALNAHEPLPKWFWTGQTDMACLRDAITQTLETGYAHHIQRLMVTGLYTLMLGVAPRQVHEWYLAVYVDAVEWVELPNVIGMSQHADGGLMASKPYIASGKYIQRMSNHCQGCRFDPAKASGPGACPFTTLYWDFLARHEARLAKNPRMVMQVKNLQRQTTEQRAAIAERAAAIRNGEVLP
jgi:deoxyribodipyrimidine photolyase-related protein